MSRKRVTRYHVETRSQNGEWTPCKRIVLRGGVEFYHVHLNHSITRFREPDKAERFTEDVINYSQSNGIGITGARILTDDRGTLYRFQEIRS